MAQKETKKAQYDVRLNWSGDYLFNQYPDGVLIICAKGIIIDVNDTFLKMTGYEKNDLLGKRMEILMPKGESRAKHVCLRKKYNKNPSKRGLESGVEPELLRKDGTSFPVDIMLSPLKTEQGMFTVTLVRDITEKQRILKNERAVKEELKAVFYSAPVAIYCLKPDRTVLSWSRAAENLFGYKAEEVVGKPYKLIPNIKGKKKECIALLDEVFTGKTVRDVHRRRLHKDGHLVDVSISAAPMYDENGKIYAATYSAEDISERLKAQERLNQLAFFDELTKLPNSASLQRQIENYFSNVKSGENRPLAVAIIELEGAREVTNTLGRQSGNELIKQVAKRIEAFFCKETNIYRTSRYEFVLTKENCGDPRIIMEAVEKIIEQIRLPFNIDNQTVHISASAGAAVAPLHGKNYEELLANVSLALNAAMGDNIRDVRFFSISIRTAAQASRQLDLELRHAFEKNEFELFYQPQISLKNGNLVGAEALVRWRHKEHGIIYPGGFIDALANNPISYKVGKWIMREAIEKCAFWRKHLQQDLRIGVNLFGSQFEHDIVEDVEDALVDFDLPANLLELEITENIALNSDLSIIKPLQKISDIGVGIAFDDFGTGYASLSYLIQYPLSRIKIDKSFLENVPKNSEKATIVSALIKMAHGLGLEVIAEGVENEEHIKFLCSKNCEEVQGYFYSKPLAEEEFIEFVKSAHFTKYKSCAAS